MSHKNYKILAACFAFVSSVAFATPKIGYDFEYLVSGSARAKPVQVFDDGRSTFFQFAPGATVPAIMVEDSGTTRVLIPKFEGPFVVVDEVHGKFDLQIGRTKTTVIHAGNPGGRADQPEVTRVNQAGMKTPYQGGQVQPQDKLVATLKPMAVKVDNELFHNSYATPIKGDRVDWMEESRRVQTYEVWFKSGSRELDKANRVSIAKLAKSLSASSHLILVGRDDDSLLENLEADRASAMKDEIVKAGFPASRIEVKTGPKSTQKGKLFASDVQVVTYASVPTTPTTAPVQTKLKTPREIQIEAMVKAGVLNNEQAQALLNRANKADELSAIGGESLPGGFNLVKSDMTIKGVVARWSEKLNYRMVWEVSAAQDAPVMNDGQIKAATFKEALGVLVDGLKSKGYQIEATIYKNRVVRISDVASKAKN